MIADLLLALLLFVVLVLLGARPRLPTKAGVQAATWHRSEKRLAVAAIFVLIGSLFSWGREMQMHGVGPVLTHVFLNGPAPRAATANAQSDEPTPKPGAGAP